MVKDSVFWFCAIVGTVLFLLTLILGGTQQNEGEAINHDGDFNWFSKQAITGFLTLFGWVGLTCIRQFHLDGLITFCLALCGGLLSFFITGLIFKGAQKLRSPGTIFQIEDVLDMSATVYQQIPPDGVGKITVVVHDRTYELDAISLNKQLLPSFSEVKIIQKIDNNTAVVIPKEA